MTVLRQLRRYREERAMTQRQLAEKSGVTQATIVHAENGGDTRPSTVRKFADALGVDPAGLVGGVTVTLGIAFRRWQERHSQTDEQLARYIGTTVDAAAALRVEPIPAEVTAGWRKSGTNEYSGPPTPTAAGLHFAAERFGANLLRLYDVILGEMSTDAPREPS